MWILHQIGDGGSPGAVAAGGVPLDVALPRGEKKVICGDIAV